MDQSCSVALHRFGLGRRPDDALPADPRQWLRDQLATPDPRAALPTPNTTDALALVRARTDLVRAQREQRPDQATPSAMPSAAPPQDAAGQRPPAAVAAPNQLSYPPPVQPTPPHADFHAIGERHRADTQDLLANAVTTNLPFRERLVWFWANHFNVSARGPIPTAAAGAYVREAIRPHVTGRFAGMLRAVMRHPAMLAYLDQLGSAGPDSPGGRRQHKGLNENLARECLELHTVSPASGYAQQDVTNFAKILTGWSVEVRQQPVGFKFRPNLHEPGSFEVLGRSWDSGEAGGLALLDWLGTHPATYRHLAEKLCRHFVADDPPAADVHRIETVLRDTRGDLGAAALVLIELPGAWTAGTKIRAPQDYVVTCLRILGSDPSGLPNLPGFVAGLGQGLFQAPFPIGWPDRAADWAGPEAMLQRADFAFTIAGRAAALDPLETARHALGPLLTQDTTDALRAAGSRRDAMTLLLASPELMRR